MKTAKTFIGWICCAALLLSAVHAQSINADSLLLPAPIRLSGIVTDTGGNPLPDASIHHAGLVGPAPRTNAEGRFEFDTRAPAIVFRKQGFNPKYVRVQRDATLEVKLEPGSGPWKACPSASRCLFINMLLSEFCLEEVRGVKTTGQIDDIDYGLRLFWIQTPSGKNGIRHGSGTNWGSGLPFDEDVWSAVEYEETDYLDREGFLVVDARGKSPNGGRWRVLGRAFETASYRDLSVHEAALLDKVLDGACLRAPSEQ